MAGDRRGNDYCHSEAPGQQMGGDDDDENVEKEANRCTEEGNSSSSLDDLLHREVMTHVEGVLSKCEESLWRRGQTELRKLQAERAQVTSHLSELQVRQDKLKLEHTSMRGALVDITEKLEFLATEMRDALMLAPCRAGGTNSGEESKTAVAAAFCAAAAKIATRGTASAETALDLKTPPRPASVATTETPWSDASGAAQSSSSSLSPIATTPATVSLPPGLGLPYTAPVPGSPAVPLSLASALIATPCTSLPQKINIADSAMMSPSYSSPPQKLHIADCLELNGASNEHVKTATSAHLIESAAINDPQMRAEAPTFVPRAEAPAFVPVAHANAGAVAAMDPLSISVAFPQWEGSPTALATQSWLADDAALTAAWQAMHLQFAK